MVPGKQHLRRVARLFGLDPRLLFLSDPVPLRPGTEAAMTPTAVMTALAALTPTRQPRRTRLSTGMLTEAERGEASLWQQRASAELLAIEDGLFGAGWLVRARAAYLKGFLQGTGARLLSDQAARN